MISGLIIPAAGPLKLVDLVPRNRASYAAALGGALYEHQTGIRFRRSLDVFTFFAPDVPGPLNKRTSWFVTSPFPRGTALFVGAGGVDIPEAFLRYLRHQGILGNEIPV